MEFCSQCSSHFNLHKFFLSALLCRMQMGPVPIPRNVSWYQAVACCWAFSNTQHGRCYTKAALSYWFNVKNKNIFVYTEFTTSCCQISINIWIKDSLLDQRKLYLLHKAYKIILAFFFFFWPSGLQGLSSHTRDQTRDLGSESAES